MSLLLKNKFKTKTLPNDEKTRKKPSFWGMAFTPSPPPTPFLDRKVMLHAIADRCATL